MSQRLQASPRVARIGAVLCGLVIAGCAAVDRTPGAAPQAGAVVDPTPQPTMPAASAVASAGAAQAPRPASPATSVPAAKAGAKTSPSLPTPPVGKAPSAAPQPPKPPAATPLLDLASLEKRLRESNAIGVVTKIALKNQVDDLLDQFRAFYQGRQKTTLGTLRQPYDRLLMKVLALLQDSDPQLASAISASREAIWGILSDPAKFAAI